MNPILSLNFRDHDTPEHFVDIALRGLAENPQPWQKAVYQFILKWFGTDNTLAAKSSGSTGEPKVLEFTRDQMRLSARNTIQFFNLNEGQRVFTPLNFEFIGGKMMLVRALEAKLILDIAAPDAPLNDWDFNYSLGSMSPLHAEKISAEDCPFRQILLGGQAISDQQAKKFSLLPAKVYLGYGMTETISHIALRPVTGNPSDDWYSCMEGVAVMEDEKKQLIIDWPAVGIKNLKTNDFGLVEGEKFRVLGRVDNIINSGGIKHIPEVLENLIFDQIHRRVVIGAKLHPSLGHQLILIVEGEPISEAILEGELSCVLHKYEMPKEIFFMPVFPETPTGKIIRKDVLQGFV